MKKKTILVIESVCLGLLLAGICLFIPIKTKNSVTVPAVMICDDKAELESTELSIDGVWKRSIAIPSRQAFTGTIQVDSLDYTYKENGWELDFQIIDEISGNCLAGGFFYNSDSNFRFTGYGQLYTDKKHDYYVLVTNQFDGQGEDYIVIAPAESKEEAQNICTAMGLSYLQDQGR